MVVYEWPNGSTVEFLQVEQIDHSKPIHQSRVCLFLYSEKSLPTSPGRFVSVWMRPNQNQKGRVFVEATSLEHAIRDSGFTLKRIQDVYPLVRNRVISFLLDAGAHMTPDHRIFSSFGQDVTRPHVPFFVSDEEWNSRYERARLHHLDTGEDTPHFLGPAGRMQIWNTPNGEWFRVRWENSSYLPVGFTSVYEASTLEGAVDLVTNHYQIWPESRRKKWEDSLDRGTFVRPSPEEVEMYRMLDEPLPFFLPGGGAMEWLRSQQSS